MGSWVLFLLGGGAILMVLYNRIVALAQKRRSAFSDIDVQLQQRYDTIPNMVDTVKSYAGHEHKVFKEVIEARTAVKDAYGIGESRFKAEQKMSAAIGNLFALVENYPDLKADKNYLYLQNELSELENKISAARRYFNSVTTEYNTAISQFPGNLMAKFMGMVEEPFFELDENKKIKVQSPPRVNMSEEKDN